jgi:hypothetical protein
MGRVRCVDRTAENYTCAWRRVPAPIAPIFVDFSRSVVDLSI